MEENSTVDIGKMLRAYVDDKRIRQGAWSRKQNVNRETIRKYFKKKTMQTDTIFAICHVLKYNFFAPLSESLPKDYGTITTADQQRIAELEKENETLKTQLGVLKEVMGGRASG